MIIFVERSFWDYFRYSAGLYIRLCIYKYYVASTVILGSVADIFRYIRAFLTSMLAHIKNLVYPWHIHIPGIFLSQSIFRLKDISIILFSQKLHLGRLIQLWCIFLLYRCYLTSRITLRYLLAFYFRHFRTYSRIIQKHSFLLRHIENPDIFRTVVLQSYWGIL